MYILVFRILGGFLLIVSGMMIVGGVMQQGAPAHFILPGLFALLGLWALLREAPQVVRKPPSRAPAPQPQPAVDADPARFFVMLDNQQSGPFTLADLRAGWQSGQVNHETLFWFEGAPDWKPLGELAAALRSPAEPA